MSFSVQYLRRAFHKKNDVLHKTSELHVSAVQHSVLLLKATQTARINLQDNKFMTQTTTTLKVKTLHTQLHC